MLEWQREQDAEALMRKTLCSVFVAIDGTITMRRDRAQEAAQVIASRLRSQGLLEPDGADVEQRICGAIAAGPERSAVFSVPADALANRIYKAIYSPTTH